MNHAMTRRDPYTSGKCLGLLESSVGGKHNTVQIMVTPINKAMWKDLEEGIIRQGNRENVTNDRYKENNPYRRIGLKFEIVDASGNLLAPKYY